MSHLRANPETRRAMTAAERTEVRALAEDLFVYLWPSSFWTSSGERLWACRIARGSITVAETANHDSAMLAFRKARAMVERREAVRA